MKDAASESAPGDEGLPTEIEDGEHEQAATTIYDVTDACFNILDGLVSTANSEFSSKQALLPSTTPVDESPRDIRGIHNNFAFWVDYTGALAPVGACLDDRLYGHKEIKLMVMELLKMVERNLRRLERSKDQNPRFQNRESQHWLSSIDLALDRLHFLAKAIRTASARRHDQDLFEFISDEDRFFYGVVLSYVKLKCPNARPSLIEHMGELIAGRRRALLNKHRHAKKLMTRRTPKPSLSRKLDQAPGSSAENEVAHSVRQLPALEGITRILPSTEGSRATQASRMDGELALQRIRQKPALSIRSTGSSQQMVTLSTNYPDPPRIKFGEKHVQCPYCLEPLPAAEMREGAKNEYWKRHVNQDLQPYACLFRRCTNSHFAHQSDWSKHMAAAHSQEWPRKVHAMTWYCDLGHLETVEFNNESDWRNHMKDLSCHPGRSKYPTAAQLDVLVVRKQQLAPRDRYICPFCEAKPQSIAILGDRGNPTDTANMLVNHIAEHVKSLSFLALPGLDSEAVEDDTSSANLKNSSAKRLRNPGSPSQPPSGVEFLENVSLNFDDDEDIGGSQIQKEPTPVTMTHPPYVENYQEHGVNHTTETSIASTESDFSWDFLPARYVPLSAVDAAFGQWVNYAPIFDNQEESKGATTYFLVPYARNPDFVGRSAILVQLKDQLEHSQFPMRDASQPRVLLYGLGGVGKTQIALEYVYQLKTRCAEMSIFWVHASNAERFRQAYASIALECKVPGYDGPKVDVLLLVKRWLETRRNR